MKLSRYTGAAVVALLTALSVAPAMAADAEAPPAPPPGLWDRDFLTGDWDGARTKLIDGGVTLGLKYTGEVFGTVSGGAHTGAAIDHQFLGTADFDFEKMGGMEGLTGHVSGFAVLGHGPSYSQIKNGLDVSSIEMYGTAPQVHERLWTLWLQKTGFDSMLSVRLGQLSTDDEFWVTNTAANLINTTFLWNALEFANQPGGKPLDRRGNLVSNGDGYPLGAPGIRVAITPNENWNWQTAVQSAQPESDVRGGTQFRVGSDQFIISELQYLENQAKDATGNPVMYKLGVQYNTMKTLSFSTRPSQQTGTSAFYGIVDRTLWKTPETGDQAVSVFLRVGGTPDNGFDPKSGAAYNVSWYVDGGIGFKGPIKGREGDIVTLGFAYAGVSDDWRKFQRATGAGVIADYEAALELNYTANLANWWSVQPDFQYVIHPGYHSALNSYVPSASPTTAVGDAVVLGIRTTLTF